jgi:hypothetical protein
MVKVYDKQAGTQTFKDAQAFSVGQTGVLFVLRVQGPTSVENMIAAFAADNWKWATTVEPQAGAPQGSTRTT